LQYDIVIPLLGIHQKELKAGSQRAMHTPTLMAALFTMAKMWKQPRYSLTDEGIIKML
jgi:hypothetical protein